MAVSKIADLITPEVYLQYREEMDPELNALHRAGIFTAPPPDVASQINAGGDIITAPYWDYIPNGFPQIPSDDDTVSITPKKVTGPKMRMRKHNWVEAWSAMDLAGILATGGRKDPLEHVLSSIAKYWHGAEQRALIASLTGMIADNVANDSSDMVYSVYSDIASPVAANKFSGAAFRRACLTLGDRLGDVSAIAMHSTVYGDLKDNEEIDFIQPSELAPRVPTYEGSVVIVDDQMPVTTGTNSDKYTCYLFGRGSVAFQPATLDPDYAVEVYRDALKGNGGGQSTVVIRENALMHPMGMDWLEASVAGVSPTETELKNAANWDRKYVRKNVKIAVLEVNAG